MKEDYNHPEVIFKAVVVEEGMISSISSNIKTNKIHKDGNIFFESITESTTNEAPKAEPTDTQSETIAKQLYLVGKWDNGINRQKEKEVMEKQEKEDRQRIEERHEKDKRNAKAIICSYAIVSGVWLTASGYNDRLEGYDITKGIWGIAILLVFAGLLIIHC